MCVYLSRSVCVCVCVCVRILNASVCVYVCISVCVCVCLFITVCLSTNIWTMLTRQEVRLISVDCSTPYKYLQGDMMNSKQAEYTLLSSSGPGLLESPERDYNGTWCDLLWLYLYDTRRFLHAGLCMCTMLGDTGCFLVFNVSHDKGDFFCHNVEQTV